MRHNHYLARADLYLGRDAATAAAMGPRGFGSVAKALRFAFEEAAPVSLHGARLAVAGRVYEGAALQSLYRSGNYPLPRKPSNAVSRGTPIATH